MVTTVPTAANAPDTKTPQTAIKLTYADYYALTPEGAKFQLFDGKLIEIPSPPIIHQEVSANIAMPLHMFANDSGIGVVYMRPLDVVLTDHDTVQPDILFVSAERNHILTEANVQGAPDMVLEILSPDSERYDLGYKMDLYAKRGVKEYWIADYDDKTIRVLLLVNGAFVTAGVYGRGQTLTSPTLPGFTLDIDNVF